MEMRILNYMLEIDIEIEKLLSKIVGVLRGGF